MGYTLRGLKVRKEQGQEEGNVTSATKKGDSELFPGEREDTGEGDERELTQGTDMET